MQGRVGNKSDTCPYKDHLKSQPSHKSASWREVTSSAQKIQKKLSISYKALIDN